LILATAGSVLKMTEHEKTAFRGWIGNIVSIVAVLVSACAVVLAATLKSGH
jgi:hypothetical protein